MTSLGPGYSSKEERRKVTGVVEAPCPSPGTRADLPGPTLHTQGSAGHEEPGLGRPT